MCIGKLCVERMKVILLHWQNLGKSIHLVGWLCESKRRRENWGFVVSRINLWQWMQYSIWMVFNATISAKWRKLASSILLFCRFSNTAVAVERELKYHYFIQSARLKSHFDDTFCSQKNYKLSNFRRCEFFTVFYKLRNPCHEEDIFESGQKWI